MSSQISPLAESPYKRQQSGEGGGAINENNPITNPPKTLKSPNSSLVLLASPLKVICSAVVIVPPHCFFILHWGFHRCVTGVRYRYEKHRVSLATLCNITEAQSQFIPMLGNTTEKKGLVLPILSNKMG